MSVLPFIPKDDMELPDWYGVTVFFITGKKEEFEIASHRLKNGQFEFVTKDDLWSWVPMSSVLRVEFDKRFSKVVAIKEKHEAEQKK